ncbi:GNAT family N-acetyltransferase [Occultella glacieicola]|uniref:GNAT family N-acetyltransferase n=1 Tax=Occultella glacieicola TaxID=2518684 RepID=A0ABY2DXT9_9MICO|nr:GNAT family N-acetyltransferase [Occultella glacieicola]TDE88939.1 GNAT family N-acetyltransferase [Occultella glacieicola]
MRTAPVPAAHLGLTWRPLTPPDVDSHLTDLANRAEIADRSLHPFTRSRIAHLLSLPGLDPDRDSLAGFDGTGVLRAAGLVQSEPSHPRALLWATLDPAWRGRGVGRALFAWQEDRAREILLEVADGRTSRIGVHVDAHLADRRRMCVAAGYAPVRTTENLELSLSQVPGRPTPVQPDAVGNAGVRIAAWTPAAGAAARTVHDVAFDGAGAQDPGTWAGLVRRLRPAWSFLAVDGAEPVGFVISSHDPDEDGARVAYTDLLAVRPDRAGAGIGRALLSTALRAYAADDMDVARLDVDARNPARDLYAGLGYRLRGAGVLYSIEL